MTLADLVDDGSTLQMGIGAIPDAALSRLGDKVGLGVHTEMFSDRVIDLWSGLVTSERRHRLTETRPPEYGFAKAAYAWVNGADLDDLLDASPIPVGDFVRVSRQLLDILRQVRDAESSLAEPIRAAIRGIDRGIVTSGGGA